MWNAARSARRSGIVSTRSEVWGVNSGGVNSGISPRGMEPKWRWASARASAGSKSPEMLSTALLGLYQVWKNSWTASSGALSRSCIWPIVECAYGQYPP